MSRAMFAMLLSAMSILPRAVPILLVVLFLLSACTTVDSLKPGAPRGTYENGFMKTTEGLSLTVRIAHTRKSGPPPIRL